jgi:hypothetical protein
VPVLAAKRLEEGGVGRVDDVADDLPDALPVLVGRALDAARDDRRFRRDRQHPLELGDDPLGDDRRRGQPAFEALAQDAGVRGHEGRVGMQPRDERLEPLGRVDRLEGGQLWEQLLRSAHLVDDAELVETLVVLLDAQVADDLEHVACDALLGRQPVDRDRPRFGGGPLHQLTSSGATGRRWILEAVGVARVAIERGGRRVELEDALPESVGEVVHGGRAIGHEWRLSQRFGMGRALG